MEWLERKELFWKSGAAFSKCQYQQSEKIEQMVKLSLAHFENFLWEAEGPWTHIIVKIFCDIKDLDFQNFKHQVANTKETKTLIHLYIKKKETLTRMEFKSYCVIRYSDHGKDTQVICLASVKQEGSAC